MLLDAQSLFSNDQDLAKAAAAYLSDKSIDVGAAGTIPAGFQARGTAPRDVGKGKAKNVLVQVTETFTSGGAGTLKVELVTADDEALTSNLAVHAVSDVIALATLAAGYQFLVPYALPPGIGADRYVGLRYTIGTATMTAGKVTAGLVFDRQTAGTP